MATLIDSASSSQSDVGTQFGLTVLGSGSSGNASIVQMGETKILIDAGFSGVEIGRRMEKAGLDPNGLDAILVTHEHSDHIKSVHTLSRKFETPIYCTEGTFEAVIAEKKFFDWQEVRPGRSFKVGEMEIHPISLPHDAADPIGFRVEANGRKLAHMTDLGYGSGLVKESLRGVDTLLLEANHDLDMLKEGPYPWYLKQRIAGRLGHLCNEHFYELLEEVAHDDLKQLVIAHMSTTNNDPRLVSMQTKRVLRRMGLAKIPFHIAQQDTPLETLEI